MINNIEKLNIGCGKNWKKFYPDYMGLDIIDYGQELVTDVLGFLKRMDEPTARNQFDEVMANHFLEHFTQDELKRIFIGVYKILKPKGLFKIVIPHKSKAEAWDLTHKTFWNKNTITKLEKLPEFGKWSVEKVIVNKRKDIHAWLRKN